MLTLMLPYALLCSLMLELAAYTVQLDSLGFHCYSNTHFDLHNNPDRLVHAAEEG